MRDDRTGPDADRRRCAVVECYHRHDEVYPTTVHLLQRLGYEVDVFTTLRNRFKNSFAHAPGLQPRMHSFLTAEQVLTAVRRQHFDLVIFNILEGREVLDCASTLQLDTAVLGFVHDGSQVRDLPEYLHALAHPRCGLMALAPHVAEHFSHLAESGTMYPVLFFDREVPRLPRADDRRRFCVPGHFDPMRRDYAGLLAALRELKRESRVEFEVYVMGRHLGRSFREFADAVRDAGLTDQVRYSWEGMGHRRDGRVLNSADFILPLITPSTHPGCFTGEATSSMATAIGFNALPVSHEDLARRYAIDDIAVTYRDELLPALRRALDMDNSELALRRDRLAKVRRQRLEESKDSLEKAVARLGLRKRPTPMQPDLRPLETLAG